MNIYTTPKKDHKTITLMAESIDDGIKIGLIKAKLDVHEIPYMIEIINEKIKGITLTDTNLLRVILGMI